MIRSILGQSHFVKSKARILGAFSTAQPSTQNYVVVTPQKSKRGREELEIAISKDFSDFNEEDLAYAKDVDGHDFKRFLQEVYEKEYAEGMTQNRFNEKAQKLVYESQPPQFHVFRYQVLAAVFGGVFLYLFYRGDSYYSTILLVPGIAAACFYVAKQHQARRAVPIIRQILRNQDNTVEIVFEQNRMIQRVENVQGASIKLEMNSQPSHTLMVGKPTDIGYHLKINGDSYIAPYSYSGNNLDFRRLLNLL